MMYLKQIRQARGLSLEELAKKTGSFKGNLSLVENGKLNLKLERAQKIAEVLKCRTTDLTGETKFDPNCKSVMIPIKYYPDVSASAGKGCFVDNENFETINIDEKHLLEMSIRSDYHNIAVIKMKGYSMEPILKDGDLLFIDTSKTELYNNKIYVINENNGLKVKRLLWANPFAKTITIKSDNQVEGEFEPYEIEIETIPPKFICGQVIFYCRNINN